MSGAEYNLNYYYQHRYGMTREEVKEARRIGAIKCAPKTPKPKPAICQRCGCDYETPWASYQKYCPDCKAEATLELVRKRDEEIGSQYIRVDPLIIETRHEMRNAYTVVRDTSEYPLKGKISNISVQATLSRGNFTPGTILERNGKRFRVWGAIGSPQKLEQIAERTKSGDNLSMEATK